MYGFFWFHHNIFLKGAATQPGDPVTYMEALHMLANFRHDAHALMAQYIAGRCGGPGVPFAVAQAAVGHLYQQLIIGNGGNGHIDHLAFARTSKNQLFHKHTTPSKGGYDVAGPQGIQKEKRYDDFVYSR